jgi:hypothetical protein
MDLNQPGTNHADMNQPDMNHADMNQPGTNHVGTSHLGLAQTCEVLGLSRPQLQLAVDYGLLSRDPGTRCFDPAQLREIVARPEPFHAALTAAREARARSRSARRSAQARNREAVVDGELELRPGEAEDFAGLCRAEVVDQVHGRVAPGARRRERPGAPPLRHTMCGTVLPTSLTVIEGSDNASWETPRGKPLGGVGANTSR